MSIIIVLRHLISNKIYLTESVSAGVITYWICFTRWREELNVWVKIWNIYFVYKIYWETLPTHFFIEYSVETIPSNYGKIYSINIFIHINCVIEVSSSISHDTTLPLKLSTHPKKKIIITKGSFQYYSNCIATYKLILSCDFELNPDSGLRKPKYKIFEKTVRSNQKHFTCEHCFEIIHSECLDYLNINHSAQTSPRKFLWRGFVKSWTFYPGKYSKISSFTNCFSDFVGSQIRFNV